MFISVRHIDKVIGLKLIIHLVALLPLLTIYYLAFTDKLGADPVQEIIHFTGIGAFNLLLLSLLINPVAKYFKQSFFLKVRRLVGLYAFTYALSHILNFLAFDLQFAWSLFFNELVERPYIFIGMLAFVILFALAITSLNTLRRKMGKSWQKLHNFTYIAAILVAVHFYWSVKSELSSPILYCLAVFILLALRYSKIKHLLLASFINK
jgi:sulfoxide reductase heme-binding subunit YedZ